MVTDKTRLCHSGNIHCLWGERVVCLKYGQATNGRWRQSFRPMSKIWPLPLAMSHSKLVDARVPLLQFVANNGWLETITAVNDEHPIFAISPHMKMGRGRMKEISGISYLLPRIRAILQSYGFCLDRGLRRLHHKGVSVPHR